MRTRLIKRPPTTISCWLICRELQVVSTVDHTAGEIIAGAGNICASPGANWAAIIGYSLAPFIHSRIVRYSGESLAQRTPLPCEMVFAPTMPSLSEVEVGFNKR